MFKLKYRNSKFYIIMTRTSLNSTAIRNSKHLLANIRLDQNWLLPKGVRLIQFIVYSSADQTVVTVYIRCAEPLVVKLFY